MRHQTLVIGMGTFLLYHRADYARHPPTDVFHLYRPGRWVLNSPGHTANIFMKHVVLTAMVPLPPGDSGHQERQAVRRAGT